MTTSGSVCTIELRVQATREWLQLGPPESRGSPHGLGQAQTGNLVVRQAQDRGDEEAGPDRVPQRGGDEGLDDELRHGHVVRPRRHAHRHQEHVRHRVVEPLRDQPGEGRA